MKHHNMAELWGDVLADILSRLPVRSLLRFKCVSRSWYDLINDPDFTKLHLRRSSQSTNYNQTLVFTSRFFPYLYCIELETLDHLRAIDQPLRPSGKLPQVLGSCNGLLWLVYFPLGEHPNSGLIYNPATRSYHKLPRLPYGNDYNETCVSAFGYDSIHDDYKIVWIFPCINWHDHIQLEDCRSAFMIYSLKDNSWRKGQSLPYCFYVPRRNAVLVNGYIHWLVRRNTREYKRRIIGFNLSDERHKEVEYPETGLYSNHISALDDSLCLIIDYVSHYDFLIMKEHGVAESWTKLFRIEGHDMSFFPLNIIGFSKNKRELFYISKPAKLDSYDLEQRKMKVIKIRGSKQCLYPFIYKESLISPKKIHPQKTQRTIWMKGSPKRSYADEDVKNAPVGKCSRVTFPPAIDY